jgi:hypothetical protein
MRVGGWKRGLWVGLLCSSACSGVIEQPWAGPGDAPPDAGPAADSGSGFVPRDPAELRDAGMPPKAAAASLSRRLSRAELDHSLADLFGDDSAPATRLLPEDLYSPYDNDVASQLASSAFLDVAVRAGQRRRRAGGSRCQRARKACAVYAGERE